MRASFASTLLLLASAIPFTYAQAAHGDGVEEEQGPVGFLWPADRLWKDENDNTGPCGSSEGPSKERANFPLLGGAVALTIADEAWEVKLRISYKSNPTVQSDFTDFVGTTISKLAEGHQCYKSKEISRDIEAGTNATIQLEYTAVDDNVKKAHYACADIVFVATTSFTETIPCFNVTSEEFATEEELENKGKSAASSVSSASIFGAAGIAVAAAIALLA
ncbi:hypothetical protein DFH27DRAFT_49998 [Peziza echinospora]|nr:hypothetical protein DFH27DRAFT_49998 [Peziza echinospora]